jgi:hypothetical protein
MASRRTTLVLLAALGAFVAHQAAYGIAGALGSGVAAPDHGYLSVAAQLVVPAGLVAIAALIVRASRSRLDLTGLSIGVLAAWQLAVFIGQEAIEAFLLGGSALHANPAVWIGVALHPVVAALLLIAARVGASVLRRLETTITPRPVSSPTAGPTPVLPAIPSRTLLELFGRRLRAPPAAA